jgi:hypothetical protein
MVIIGLLCLQLVLVGIFAASTTAEALSGLPWHGQLPNDSTLGQVSDPAYPVHPVIWRSYEAFSDFYGPLWYEKHVHSESRFIVNKMYDALLASALPATVSLGAPSFGKDQVAISMKLHGQGGSESSVSVVWVPGSEGRWMIRSISSR